MFQNMKVMDFILSAGSEESRRKRKGDVLVEGCTMVMLKTKLAEGVIETSGIEMDGGIMGVGVVSTCSGVVDWDVMGEGAVSGGAVGVGATPRRQSIRSG